jgi:hypothetical protein
VNLAEAKTILLLYRAGTADADDPQVAAALALTKQSPELARWLEEQSAVQLRLRARFKQISPPAGLKEQIVSEFTASRRARDRRRTLGFALAVLLLWLGLLAAFWPPHRVTTSGDTLANYQNRMVRAALGGYDMDLMTNDLATIRAFLARQSAPADFNLPTPLEHTALTGCAVRDWRGARVSLLCFRTGKPLPPGIASDLWLFVVDRAAVKDAPSKADPQFSKVSRLITATWANQQNLYFLGVEGQEPNLKRYL